MKDILMGLSDVNANCIIHNNDVAMTNQSINQSINDVYSWTIHRAVARFGEIRLLWDMFQQCGRWFWQTTSNQIWPRSTGDCVRPPCPHVWAMCHAYITHYWLTWANLMEFGQIIRCACSDRRFGFFFWLYGKNVVTSRDILLPLDIPECTSVKQLLACTQAQVGACLIGFSMSEEFAPYCLGYYLKSGVSS